MSQLRADNLVKVYKRRQVVNGVSLQVDSGEVVLALAPPGGFLGPFKIAEPPGAPHCEP